MKRGVATFTLDTGRCPRWLFERMVRLGREMTRAIIFEYGSDEYIKRLGDPVWFQALGTVLAFDWNASGLTTTLTGALKEAIRGEERELGIFICGGKGKTSRKTPEQITNWGERLALPEADVSSLVYNSRMSAKVDSSLVQDGYQLYHHTFFFSENGAWTVVQQGMNKDTRSARRYHWHSAHVKDIVCEPHTGIATEARHCGILNLTARKSDATREMSTEMVSGSYKTLMQDVELLRKHSGKLSKMISLRRGKEEYTALALRRGEFTNHDVELEDFSKSKYLEKILGKLTDEKPKTYESLLKTPGVGPKTIRALSLVSEIIYGATPSYEDPARYSFAHGGKDATPYPVDQNAYDTTIKIMQDVVRKTRLAPQEKDKALERLQQS